MRKVVLFALFAVCAYGQTPQTRPKKVLTPQQVAYQLAMKDYSAKLDQHRQAATAAYNAEMAREKAPECPNANTTYDENMCIEHEDAVTDTNYKAFITALRAMLALPVPASPGIPTPITGPTGPEATPATNTAAFDTAESAWHTYSTAECGAVDTLWRGGTIVNSMVGRCHLRMARARMHELDEVYLTR